MRCVLDAFLYFVWKRLQLTVFLFYIIKNVSARQKWYYSPLDLVTSDAPVNTDCQDFLSEFLATLLIFFLFCKICPVAVHRLSSAAMSRGHFLLVGSGLFAALASAGTGLSPSFGPQ